MLSPSASPAERDESEPSVALVTRSPPCDRLLGLADPRRSAVPALVVFAPCGREERWWIDDDALLGRYRERVDECEPVFARLYGESGGDGTHGPGGEFPDSCG
jgi:hypothetical protein